MSAMAQPSTSTYPEQLEKIQHNMSRFGEQQPGTMGALSTLRRVAAQP